MAQRMRWVTPLVSKEATDEWTRAADEVSLVRLDEVGGHPRPSGLGLTYAEQEYETLGNEQVSGWSAEGEAAARPAHVQARGRDASAAAATFLVSEHEAEVRAAYADHQHALRVLTPYVRREPVAKLRYWICWPILVIGDASSVLSAAIMLGDIPWVAAGQALAAGLSAACAGLVGSELKHLQLARGRRRDPEALSDDERRYQRLFTGGDSGLGVMRLVGVLSLTVVLLLAVGIFALRTSVEGAASGLTFGLLAAATAIGSALLGYSAADEVADLLATMAKRVRRAEARHQALAGAAAIRVRAAAEESARSIQSEYQHRGQAASRRVDALRYRVLRRNPQVVGHGLPTGEQTGIVGRRSRRNGAA
ncbi:MAG: hypothetical protein ACRDTS_16685 [Mycobacterium sp.]